MNDSAAFTTEQVLRVTGVTKRKLDYWVKVKRLVKPDVSGGKGRGQVRLFSFRNLLEVRVIVWLRDKVSLQVITKIVQRLTQEGLDQPLSEVTFGVIEKKMNHFEVVLKREDGQWESTNLPGQVFMEIVIPIGELREAVADAAAKDKAKQRKVGKIERRRGVLGSAPVIAGTRVPVKAVWNLHRAGYSQAEILRNYPELRPADVRAAIKESSKTRKSA